MKNRTFAKKADWYSGKRCGNLFDRFAELSVTESSLKLINKQAVLFKFAALKWHCEGVKLVIAYVIPSAL